MVILDEDALKYIRRYYIKNCIGLFILGAGLYALYAIMVAEDEKIENLTKKVKELSSKGE